MVAGWHVCDAGTANIHAARGTRIPQDLLGELDDDFACVPNQLDHNVVTHDALKFQSERDGEATKRVYTEPVGRMLI